MGRAGARPEVAAREALFIDAPLSSSADSDSPSQHFRLAAVYSVWGGLIQGPGTFHFGLPVLQTTTYTVGDDLLEAWFLAVVFIAKRRNPRGRINMDSGNTPALDHAAPLTGV